MTAAARPTADNHRDRNGAPRTRRRAPDAI